MTITQTGTGTVSGGATSVSSINPNFPVTMAKTDIAVLTVAVKPYTATITTPTTSGQKWEKIDDYTSGTTAGGANSGSVRVYQFVITGQTFTGAMGVISQSGATDMAAVIDTFSLTAGQIWDYSAKGKGRQSTVQANVSATSRVPLLLESDDSPTVDDVIYVSAAASNTTNTYTSPTLTQPGTTFGSSIGNRSSSGTQSANHVALLTDARLATTGTFSVPTAGWTNAATCEAAGVFLRLRAVSKTPRRSWQSSINVSDNSNNAADIPGDLYYDADNKRFVGKPGESSIILSPAHFHWYVGSQWNVTPPGSVDTLIPMTLNRAYAIPMYLGRWCTFSGIGIDVTTAGAASNTLRAGIYSSNQSVSGSSATLPATLIADFGTLSSTSTGFKTAWTTTPDYTLDPTLYWIVIVSQTGTACGVRGNISSNVFVSESGTPSDGRVYSSYYSDTGFSGSLPASFGSIAGVTTGPLLKVKFS